uniref:Uncharacterized protein n=1 Tax=Marseillevirus sp. TaxID=2809551 RepID=A0AA96ELH3_9VIRU|nr:hypothetical protein MarFTMF_318 [Marseillevirus sp.]
MSQRPFVRNSTMFSGRKGDTPCRLPEGFAPVRDCGCIGEGKLCVVYDILSRSRLMMSFYETVDLLAWERTCQKKWREERKT